MLHPDALPAPLAPSAGGVLLRVSSGGVRQGPTDRVPVPCAGAGGRTGLFSSKRLALLGVAVELQRGPVCRAGLCSRLSAVIRKWPRALLSCPRQPPARAGSWREYKAACEALEAEPTRTHERAPLR